MVNLLPTIRLAESILKYKFPSIDKPFRIYAPPKISASNRVFEKYKLGLIFRILRYITIPKHNKKIKINCNIYSLTHTLYNTRKFLGFLIILFLLYIATAVLLN